jgi:hypothetical protein
MFALGSALMYGAPLAVFIALVVAVSTQDIRRSIVTAIVGFLPVFMIVWLAEYVINVSYTGFLGGYAYLLWAWGIGLALAAVVNSAFGSSDESYSRSRHSYDDDRRSSKPAPSGKGATGLLGSIAVAAIVFAVASYVVVNIYNSVGASNHTAWASLGNISKAPKGEKPVVPDTDPNEFIVTDVHLAYTRAHTALGTGGNNLGSYFEVNEADGVQQWIDGKNWIVFPLQLNSWSEQEGWMTRQIYESPGFVAVPTDDPDGEIKIVDNMHLLYMTGSYFSLNLQRYVYSHGYSDGYLDDPTLEISDDWKAYWTITYVQPAFTVGGNVVKKILVVNAETGKIDEYKPDQVPAWVDRVTGQDLVTEWTKHYGLWSVVPDMFNNNSAGQKKPDIVRLVNVKGQHQFWQIPMLANNDKAVSSNGLILYDTRAQKGTFYEADAVSGMPSYAVLKGVFENIGNNNRGWHVDAIQWYQIRGVSTYMAVYAKQLPTGQTVFAGVGFLKAGTTNSADVQYGESRDAALEKYYDFLDGLSVARVDADQTTVKATVSGTIVGIGHENLGTNGLVQYTIVLKGDDRIFTLPRTVSPLLVVAKEGHKVTLTFEEPKNPANNRRSALSFEDSTLADLMKANAEQK